jgi:hypothetical protein
MITIEEKLGSWHDRVSRIVSHMIPPKRHEGVMKALCYVKNHHDQIGMVCSGLDRIVEVCYDNDSYMEDAIRCLGFRGVYDFYTETKDVETKYDLCILSRHINRRKLKNIICTDFMKAFEDG